MRETNSHNETNLYDSIREIYAKVHMNVLNYTLAMSLSSSALRSNTFGLFKSRCMNFN